MNTSRKTSRRSFLATVAGGGLALGGLVLEGTAPGQTQSRQSGGTRMVVDTDPSDPARPLPTPRPPGPGPTTHSQTGNSPTTIPSERFVVCPGHQRCPPR